MAAESLWYPDSMTTVNTIEDIITAMRERPEVRDAIRREVLTEEILSLPEKFTTLTQRGDDLTARLDILTQRVGDLTIQIAEIVKVQKDHTDKLGILIGDRLERRIATILPPALSERLGLRRTQIIYHPSLLPSSDSGFTASIEDAADRGVITDEQEMRLKVTDLIIRARRKSDGAEVWVAAEASGTIDRSDVARAADSAAGLGAVFGESAFAVVVGHRIRHEDRARAEAQGVTVVIEDEP